MNNQNSEAAQRELEIEQRVAEKDQSHRGYGIMRVCQEGCEIEGPDGSHLCLVNEPMREPLWILQRRFVDRKFPLSIAKAFLYILLAGLDYLHSVCGIVHTGKNISAVQVLVLTRTC